MLKMYQTHCIIQAVHRIKIFVLISFFITSTLFSQEQKTILIPLDKVQIIKSNDSPPNVFFVYLYVESKKKEFKHDVYKFHIVSQYLEEVSINEVSINAIKLNNKIIPFKKSFKI